MRNKVDHLKKARELYKKGYNCAQSVFLAYGDCYDIDSDTAAKMSSSMGGGIGRLRETCGAVSGMVLVAGLLYGYSLPTTDAEEKSAHYARVRELTLKFKEENGSYNCAVLTDVVGLSEAEIEIKNSDLSKKVDCTKFVESATKILDEYINANPPTKYFKY